MIPITYIVSKGKNIAKPVVLQVGPNPDWDQAPLDEGFDVKQLFAASDKQSFLAKHSPQVLAIATRGELGADATLTDAWRKLEMISVYGVGYEPLIWMPVRVAAFV